MDDADFVRAIHDGFDVWGCGRVERPVLSADQVDACLAALPSPARSPATPGIPAPPAPPPEDVGVWAFLDVVASQRSLLLHGSQDPGIAEFEPRLAPSSTEFASRRAVYATADAAWSMFYALLNRAARPYPISNGFHERDGVRHYYLSVDSGAVGPDLFRAGTVYLLPRDTFVRDPDEDDHWASELPVVPLARVAVTPEDFPLRDHVWGHDSDLLLRRLAGPDLAGYPFYRDTDLYPVRSAACLRSSTQEGVVGA